MSHELDYTRRRRLDYGSGRRASSGFGSFGAAGSCPVPNSTQVPTFMPYFTEIAAAYSGGHSYTWDWCMCMFDPISQEARFKECTNKDAWFYPWTIGGKVERGWWDKIDITAAINDAVHAVQVAGQVIGGQGGQNVSPTTGGGGGGGTTTPRSTTMNPALLVVGGLLLGKALKVF